ncbi:sulfotransferase family protein [Niveibacterium umoris]
MIVLGMHRSGTSAMAAALQHMGVVMGGSLYAENEWNPKGYFEDQAIVAFNNLLLRECDRRWDSPLPPVIGDLSEWEGRVEDATRLLDGLFAGAALWGFKDPRMCVLAPFWREVFARRGIQPRLLMAVRDPAEVAHSLQRRDGISASRAAWLWMTHLLGALDYLDVAVDARFLDFSDLLKRPADHFAELADWLEVTPPDVVRDRFAADFISPDLAHGRVPASEQLPLLATRAYLLLREAAANSVPPRVFRDSAAWKDLLRDFREQVLPELESVQRFLERDRQLDVLEGRLDATSRGLSVAEQIAADRLQALDESGLRERELADALAAAERLSDACHRELAAHGQRLAETQEALETCQNLALARQDDLIAIENRLRETELAFQRSQELALARQHELGVLDLRLGETQKALQQNEALALERLTQLAALDEQLKATDAAFTEAERLALERQGEISVLRKQSGELAERMDALTAELDAIRSTRWWRTANYLGLIKS